MINRQKIATVFGLLAGVTVVAYASSTACNKAVQVDCTDLKTENVSSPNCAEYSLFPSDVIDVGNVWALTAATTAGTGYTQWNESPQRCTYVCQIIADCKGLSPQVVQRGFRGDYVKASGGESCP